MQIVVPRERTEGERRVALTPDAVPGLLATGHTIVVEHGAGTEAGFPDADYLAAGARLSDVAAAVYAAADVVLQVQRPELAAARLLRPGATLIGLLQPLTHPQLIAELCDRRVTALSMDAVPRIAAAQAMDALSSMSTVAGYRAVILAAAALPKLFPLLMTAAGVVAPAKVLVIGAGVAGLQAIATARRLGAVVEAYDTRPAVQEQVQSLGARFVALPLGAGETEDRGGYARQLSADVEAREQALIAERVAAADVVIATAQLPGQPAPRLIAVDAVRAMRNGSVIVDLAAESGGNCALTEPGVDVVRHGVTIIGRTNLPAELPGEASRLYTRNLVNLVQHLVRDGALHLDFTDAIAVGACITHDGQIRHPAVRERVDELGGTALAAGGRR